MKILNLGSLNIDKVYKVQDFVSAGETVLTEGFETFCGGKGLNQSIALARAGAEVYHAGAVGLDGTPLVAELQQAGVDTRYLQKLDTVSGHAVIQLNSKGQNCIIVCSGANGQLTEDYVDLLLGEFGSGDILLLQNEINCVAYAMRAAKAKGMKIAFNASPINQELLGYPLELVDYYLINEVEGRLLGSCPEADNAATLAALEHRFPSAVLVLTVGKDGVLYSSNGYRRSHSIYDVTVVDTTAAGDTFCGYFLAGVVRGMTPDECLRYASLASSLAVSRKGAAPSIPTLSEVEAFGKTAVKV